MLDSVLQFLSNVLWSFQKILSTNFFKKITQGILWFFKIYFKVIQNHWTHLNETLFKFVIFFLRVMFTAFIIGNSDLHANLSNVQSFALSIIYGCQCYTFYPIIT